MARLIDINATHGGKADHHGVEALDQADGVDIRVIGIENRQTIGCLIAPRAKQRRSLGSQGQHQFAHRCGGSICRHEHDNRIKWRHQAEWTMLKLGAAERLGVKIAGLLQLERRLAGDGERRSATDGDETRCKRQRIQ